ncbi:hypothetical protein [Bacillus sp. sid0103]|uniref:hypothetical protein n=1 Tax=Bacillus sp. sid0103 TaxID=2856337 RepID=UPI00210952C0|nr:hypothetical protein [Bacillus sp. sid0103]
MDKDMKKQVGKEKPKSKRNIEQDLGCKVVSLVANKKWLSLPKETRNALERNVWCGICCDAIQIENYTISETKFGITLDGECSRCGNKVTRLIED